MKVRGVVCVGESTGAFIGGGYVLCGERVRWSYWRHLGGASWVGRKNGVFYGLCPRKWGYVRVLFDGNKNLSRVPYHQLVPEK
jgi:hypothetical protein